MNSPQVPKHRAKCREHTGPSIPSVSFLRPYLLPEEILGWRLWKELRSNNLLGDIDSRTSLITRALDEQSIIHISTGLAW